MHKLLIYPYDTYVHLCVPMYLEIHQLLATYYFP